MKFVYGVNKFQILYLIGFIGIWLGDYKVQTTKGIEISDSFLG